MGTLKMFGLLFVCLGVGVWGVFCLFVCKNLFNRISSRKKYLMYFTSVTRLNISASTSTAEKEELGSVFRDIFLSICDVFTFWLLVTWNTSVQLFGHLKHRWARLVLASCFLKTRRWIFWKETEAMSVIAMLHQVKNA